jgi:hypothetical protein
MKPKPRRHKLTSRAYDSIGKFYNIKLDEIKGKY